MATTKNAATELFKNVVLAFVAGFVTSFSVVVAATPENPGFAALASAAGAAAYAGFRGAVGFIAAKSGNTLTVDK
jgi:hypothetical protein